MLRQFIRNNITLVAVGLFILLFGGVQYFKPLIFYTDSGEIRPFGLGYKNKTIVPIWLFSILLGIICYLFVLYYLAYPKIVY